MVVSILTIGLVVLNIIYLALQYSGQLTLRRIKYVEQAQFK